MPRFTSEVHLHAGMVELVDTLDLGSSAARRGGSTPFTRTLKINAHELFLIKITICANYSGKCG